MLKKILLLFAFLMMILPLSVQAQATEKIDNFNVNITVNSDSSVSVQEKISYFFPNEKHGIYRTLPNRYLDKTKNRYFKTPISDIKITDKNDIRVPFTKTQEGDFLKLKIGDPDKTLSGDYQYNINYKISGIINNFDDHDELYYNATGNDWTVPISNVLATVALPKNVTVSSLKQSCFTGKNNSTDKNCRFSSNENILVYQAQTGPLTIVSGWNKGLVTSTTRQFEKSWRYESLWYWLIPFLVLILMLIFYFKKGKDPFGRGTIAPEFEAPDELRPAQLGTLIDEKADAKDISATLIDLAIRGYIKIKQTDKKYSIIKVKPIDANVRPYEKMLLEAILGGKNEADLSEIHIDSEMGKIKEQLYNDMVNKKYFAQSPHKIRSNYLGYGIGVIVVGSFLYWLSWHLVFALELSGLIVIIFAKFMPKKTKMGVITKEKALGLKEFIYRADRYKLKWQEKENIFEKFLPYAMVFGVANHWAKNFQNIYKTDQTRPNWYDGNFSNFNAVIFASEINHFSSSAQSAYAPAAASGGSGFSGGSSGGGFGGGGGGSW